MSGKIMGQVWDLELPHAHMLVLLALADHADHQGGSVYPGVGLVAWKCGYSLRQTQRIMDDLVASRLLVEIENDPGKRTVYRIDLAAGKQKPPYKGRQNVTRVKKSRVTFSRAGGDILVDQGVTFSSNPKPTNGAAPSTKPPRSSRTNRHVEPSIEPPPPAQPQNEAQNGGAGGGGGGGGSVEQGTTETERYLLDQLFSDSAAHEFRDLDRAACERDIKQARASGQQNGGIIKRWRRSPPKPKPPVAAVPPERPPDRNDRATTAQKLRALQLQLHMTTQEGSDDRPHPAREP